MPRFYVSAFELHSSTPMFEFTRVMITAENLASAVATALETLEDQNFAFRNGYEKPLRLAVYDQYIQDTPVFEKRLRTATCLNPRILGFTDDFTHADFVNVLHDLDNRYNVIATLKKYRKDTGKPVDSAD